MGRVATSALFALTGLIALAGCEVEETLRRTQTETMGAPLTSADYEDVRRKVLGGAMADFKGTRPPRGFRGCFARRLGSALTDDELQGLIDIHAEAGAAATARALNRLAAPAGDSCGGRRHVPQLIEAADGLRLSP